MPPDINQFSIVNGNSCSLSKVIEKTFFNFIIFRNFVNYTSTYPKTEKRGKKIIKTKKVKSTPHLVFKYNSVYKMRYIF